jgi:hypothetical protein
MHYVNPIYLEHQLGRWMQPDAHRFIRPDWRRFVRPEFQADHPFALYEGKYSPDQPRVPPACPVIAVTSASATFIVGAAGRSKAGHQAAVGGMADQSERSAAWMGMERAAR